MGCRLRVHVWGARSGRTLGTLRLCARGSLGAHSWGSRSGCSPGLRARAANSRCSWGAGWGCALRVCAWAANSGRELEVLLGCRVRARRRGGGGGGCHPPDASLGCELSRRARGALGGAASGVHAQAASSGARSGVRSERQGGGVAVGPLFWGGPVPPVWRFPRGRLFVSGNGFCMWQLLQERAALPERACAEAREGEPGRAAKGRRG